MLSSYIICLIVSFLIFNIIDTKTPVHHPAPHPDAHTAPHSAPHTTFHSAPNPTYHSTPRPIEYTPVHTNMHTQTMDVQNNNIIHFAPQPTIQNTISTINNINITEYNLIITYKINCGSRCIFIDNSHNDNYLIAKCTLKSYRYDDRSISGLISTNHRYLNLSNVTFYGYNYKELIIENTNYTKFNQTIFYKCYNCNINQNYNGWSVPIAIFAIMLLMIIFGCIIKCLEPNKKELYDPIV